MDAENRPQGEVATELGVSQQLVSAWRRGASRPDEVSRLKLELRYGIPRDSWLSASEQRNLAEFRAGLIRRGIGVRATELTAVAP
jgi:transcriptional regulator with XRE-family HTH domain